MRRRFAASCSSALAVVLVGCTGPSTPVDTGDEPPAGSARLSETPLGGDNDEVLPPVRPDSSTRYLYAQCHGETYSPLSQTFDLPDSMDHGMLLDLWVEAPGDELLDFDGAPTGITEFSPADIDAFHSAWRGQVPPISALMAPEYRYSPETPLYDDFLSLAHPEILAEYRTPYVESALTAANWVAGVWDSQVRIDDLTQMATRPGSTTLGDFDRLDPLTTNVEFTVPAGAVMEAQKRALFAEVYPVFLVKSGMLTPSEITDWGTCAVERTGDCVDACASTSCMRGCVADIPDVYVECTIDVGRAPLLRYFSLLAPFLLEGDVAMGHYQVPAPVETYKLRGYFIDGDGSGPEPSAPGPLIVLIRGVGDALSNSWDGGNLTDANPNKSLIETYRAFAARGYDVLLLDESGVGYSEGFCRICPFTPAGPHEVSLEGLFPYVRGVHPLKEDASQPAESGDAVNIFHVLDQLGGRPDGIGGDGFQMVSFNPHTDAAPVVGRALIHPDAPVILHGESRGALYVMRAMQLRYDPPPGAVLDYSGHDLRGVVQASGVASLEYWAYSGFTPPAAAVLQEGYTRDRFDVFTFSGSDMMDSIAEFPGWMGVKGMHDGNLPQSDIDAYNTARGVKEVALTMGDHLFTWAIRANNPYVLDKTLQFSDRAVHSSRGPNNTAQTTLEREVCRAPYVEIPNCGEMGLDVEDCLEAVFVAPGWGRLRGQVDGGHP